MGIIKKIVHLLANVCYILIILYVIVCIPMIFGYRPVVVLSGSMNPSYKVGSVVYYKSIPSSELKVNDVVVFSPKVDDGRLVCHRIVEIDGNYVVTKGDANKEVDATKTSVKDIYGKVAKYHIVYIGYYIQFINNHLYLAVLSAIFILVSEFLISNTEIFDIDRRKERSEEHGRKEEKE